MAGAENPDPEGRSRGSGPLLGIAIVIPISLALWAGIVWLFF
ncbi:hypothetical protein [Sphingomonas sp. G-3-2-10]|nr:hypothetical protein [Sphingomonas sp. G-3-2-10]